MEKYFKKTLVFLKKAEKNIVKCGAPLIKKKNKEKKGEEKELKVRSIKIKTSNPNSIIILRIENIES